MKSKCQIASVASPLRNDTITICHCERSEAIHDRQIDLWQAPSQEYLVFDCDPQELRVSAQTAWREQAQEPYEH